VWSKAGGGPAVFFRFSNTLGKLSVNKYQKTDGGWIMTARSLLLTALIPVTGVTLLSLPAGAECWMTCPPGSTTTPRAMGEQGAAATADQAASPEELTPAKKPSATAKASPGPVPAKPKAAPRPVEPTAQPAASPEDPTPAKDLESTAKASSTPVPEKPKAAPTPAGAGLPGELPQVQSMTPTPAPAPTQDAVAQPAPVPQPSETNPALHPAPVQPATPAPVPLPGPVPGTATMHVIPE
jgi:hypothetical protein